MVESPETLNCHNRCVPKIVKHHQRQDQCAEQNPSDVRAPGTFLDLVNEILQHHVKRKVEGRMQNAENATACTVFIGVVKKRRLNSTFFILHSPLGGGR